MKTHLLCAAILAFTLPTLRAADTAPAAAPAAPIVLHIDAAKVTAHVRPTLYGLMTEEINYSYDGGLYAELVRNRTFQDHAENPVHWTLLQDAGGTGAIALDREQSLNAALPVSLRLDVTAAPEKARVGIANDGFWGIPVKPNTTYQASFYAKAAAGFSSAITVGIEGADGSQRFATATVPALGDSWKRYVVELKTGQVAETKAARLVLATSGTGTVWFDLVSLFPPTWHDRPNGNRRDIMQLLAAMKPSFLRFPGGNYLQGKTLATRFDWKKTLGDVSERPGHLNDAWNYRSSDGMGLLEFLLWCEDLGMEPVLGVFAGFTLNGVPKTGAELQPFIDDALEEIEYVMGDVSTTWGARRAKDGHPAPFKLTYVEVGNEDFFDRRVNTYDQRYTQFYDAIKAKYPQLQIIATTKVTSRTPDVIDEHYYPRQPESFEADATRYDSYDRKGPKIFVGEWATRIGSPTPNLLAAISDAAWMTGMERNSDIVVMHAYAPLFVNVSDLTPRTGSMQWGTDLIGYDALRSYGSPSYYAQVMFSANHGDIVLATQFENNPTRDWQPPRPRSAKAEDPAPAPKKVPAVFTAVTRDAVKGTIYVKLVNSTDAAHPVRVELSGVSKVESAGKAIVLTSAKPEDTNTLAEPSKVVPISNMVADFGPTFTRDLPPYSVTVLVLNTK